MIESGSFVADVSATTWEQTGNRFFQGRVRILRTCGLPGCKPPGALKSEQL
jgi:hypothetical protein